VRSARQLDAPALRDQAVIAGVVDDALAVDRHGRPIVGFSREGVEARLRDDKKPRPSHAKRFRRRAVPGARDGRRRRVAVDAGAACLAGRGVGDVL